MEEAMVDMENLKIVYFPLKLVVKHIEDVDQIGMEPIVQHKLIQGETYGDGPDATDTAKNI